MSNYFVGIDIGGTFIKSSLINDEGKQLGDVIELPSLVKEGYRTTFGQIEKCIAQLTSNANINKNDIKGVGMAFPGATCKGVVWIQSNLCKDWEGVDLATELSKQVGVPVFITKDTNAAGIAEYAWREGCNGLLFVAAGTGLGASMVLPNGKLWEGNNGWALELGHIAIPFRDENGELPSCGCGMKGCTETWVSLVGLRRRLNIESQKENWKGHILTDQNEPLVSRASKVRDLAADGDPLAVMLMKEQANILGYALADATRILDPGLIVIGGGLAKSRIEQQYLEWIMEGFRGHGWPMLLTNPINGSSTTRFEWAIGGPNSGAFGAAYWARNNVNK